MFNKRLAQERLYKLQNTVSSAPQSQSTTATSSTPSHKQPGMHWIKRCIYHAKIHKKREENEIKARHVKLRRDVYMNPLAEKKCDGDLKYQKLLWWLNNMCIQRSPDQVLFHKWFTQACLPKIYGTEQWNANSVRVMRELKLEKIRYEVTAITPSVQKATVLKSQIQTTERINS